MRFLIIKNDITEDKHIIRYERWNLSNFFPYPGFLFYFECVFIVVFISEGIIIPSEIYFIFHKWVHFVQVLDIIFTI